MKKYLIICTGCIALAGCNSDDSNNSNNQPNFPSVIIEAPDNTENSKNINAWANTSGFGDTYLEYQWEQIEGPDLDFDSNLTSPQINFKVPHSPIEGEIALKVLVRDKSETKSAEDTKTIILNPNYDGCSETINDENEIATYYTKDLSGNSGNKGVSRYYIHYIGLNGYVVEHSEICNGEYLPAYDVIYAKDNEGKIRHLILYKNGNLFHRKNAPAKIEKYTLDDGTEYYSELVWYNATRRAFQSDDEGVYLKLKEKTSDDGVSYTCSYYRENELEVTNDCENESELDDKYLIW